MTSTKFDVTHDAPSDDERHCDAYRYTCVYVNTFTRSETERSQERSTETEVPVIAGYINTSRYYIFTQRVPRIIS